MLQNESPKFHKKFSQTEAPYMTPARPLDPETPMTNEGLETFWNNQLIVIKPPAPAEHMSVDWPILMWHDVSPKLKFLVVTSSQELANRYSHLTCGMEKPCETKHHTREVVGNVSGGEIVFSTFGSATMGRRVDFVLGSDPKGSQGDEAQVLRWLQEAVRCRRQKPTTR